MGSYIRKKKNPFDFGGSVYGYAQTMLNIRKFISEVSERRNFSLSKTMKIADYSDGIRTKRLFNGNLIDWNPDESVLSEGEEKRKIEEIMEKRKKLFNIEKTKKIKELFKENKENLGKKIRSIERLKSKKTIKDRIKKRFK